MTPAPARWGKSHRHGMVWPFTHRNYASAEALAPPTGAGCAVVAVVVFVPAVTLAPCKSASGSVRWCRDIGQTRTGAGTHHEAKRDAHE